MPFRHPLRVACLLAAVLAAPSGARASPGLPADLVLSYAAYVHGFRALVATVDLRMTGDGYAVSFADHTVGLVGAVIDSNVASRATGRFDAAGAPSPIRYESHGHSRGADRRTDIDWAGTTPTVRVLAPVEANRDRIAPADTVGTVDPLAAAAALFRRVALGEGCADRARIFDGARLSTLQSWDGGTTTLPTNDASPFAGAATTCAFRTVEIGGFLHDDNFARAHAPQGGFVWLAPVASTGVPVPIRARFSTVEHGEIDLFLLSARSG